MAGARTITERELRTALSVCDTRRHSTRDKTIVLFSVLAGLRACELAALTVAHAYGVDGKPHASSVLHSSQTKGHRSRRIYINSKLQRVLRDYWHLVKDRAPDAPLFQTQHRRAFSANTMSQLFLDIYHSVGLKGCSAHSGRKTFITRLADQGVAVHLLAELAGHRHISTTQRYITVNEALLSRAVELA
jgi:integrase/recombinase XerD